MKTRQLVLVFVALIMITKSFAQERVEVSVVEKEMSKGKQTAFVVYIPEADLKTVETHWKKFINERSLFEFATRGTSQTVERAFIGITNIFSKDKKTFEKNSMKVEKIGDEFVVKNVVHEDVTNNHIDVYARISASEYGVNLSSFFQYSDSVFISENNISADAVQSLKNYVREFGIETYQTVVEKQIFEQKKAVRHEEGILRNMENKNKSIYNSIGKYETEIDECYNEIRMIENDLDRIENDIAENKAKLSYYQKKTEAYDSQKDVLKSVEKQYRSEYKKIKGQKNKIKRNETRIRKANADILINDKDHELQLDRIKTEETKLSELENKLANIK